MAHLDTLLIVVGWLAAVPLCLAYARHRVARVNDRILHNIKAREDALQQRSDRDGISFHYRGDTK